ncbi:MAG: hypothetical protein II118_05770 [Ruminococcus sp.]|nr:hypothetical protein [Ruminococcus sp.]
MQLFVCDFGCPCLRKCTDCGELFNGTYYIGGKKATDITEIDSKMVR